MAILEQKKSPDWAIKASKKYYQKNKLSLIARAKKYREDKLKEDPLWLSRQIKLRRLKNPQKFKNWSKSSWVRRRFGIEREEYENILENQDSKCAICAVDISGNKKALDHCHNTGKIRAFLCKRCNCGIGFFSDNPVLLNKALDYLKEKN